MLPTHKLSPLRIQLCLPATCPAQSDNLVKYGVRGSDGQEVMKSILKLTCLVCFSNKGWMGKLWKDIWMFDGWELYVYGNFHVKCQMMFTG